MLADGPASEEQISAWRKARQLAHPNLLAIIDCGRTETAGDECLYAVFEYPEDSAAAALQHASMTAAETQEVLVAAAGALGYLHSNGLVHTAVDPDHIVAVEDRIKLASDTVRQASARHRPDDDIRALGATLYELLTRQRINSPVEPDLSKVPEPFPAVIRHALKADWSLERILEEVNRPESQAAAVPAPEGDLPRPPAASPDLPSAAAVKTPSSDAPPELPVSRRPSPPRAGGFPKWAYAAAAIAVIAVVYSATSQRGDDPRPVADTAVRAAPNAQVEEQPSPAPSAVSPQDATPDTAPPPAVLPAPAPVVPVPQSAVRAPSAPARQPEDASRPDTARTRPAQVWRVIAYTYSGMEAAEKRAEAINERWPDFRAEVFVPPTQGRSRYLVALGGPMTRDQAAQLQSRARSSGLPRDTYIQNYSR
jgi:hypothetical protein